MEIKTNYHTHTYLCKHAEGKPIDYVRYAKKLGYLAIGITDHGPLIDEILTHFTSRRMSYQEYYDFYLPEIQEAKKEEGIKVYSGLEIEYFKSMENNYKEFLSKLDYLVLGQHYYYFKDHYHNMYDEASVGSINAYKTAVIDGIKSGYFKIVAHPDIYCIKYGVWDDECKKVAQDIIQAAIDNNCLLELNANGIRNSKRKNMYYYTSEGHISYGYPKYEFWQLVSEMKAKVVINDDAHYFKYLHDDATKEVYKLAEELNLNVTNQIE